MEMPARDDVSWSAMIDGYMQGGYCKEALAIFQEMQNQGIKPKKFVLSNALAACVNVGSFDQVEHYGCVVDILGRAGHLTEAEEFIRFMPMKSNAAIWGALLGASSIYGNIELGEKVRKLLLELDHQNRVDMHLYRTYMQKLVDGMKLHRLGS
ncbi:hypothetical protein IFM89_018330 [Coptis chinensis]|uniref:Pentatricopeptide repeat-containing protein n=1 Tax=Coptis chinensis TaxID=261450 RepID=A0A835ILP5_9MAGN|nr:hypothetical protein IFM89_018330 [Coptis chinensis]